LRKPTVSGVFTTEQAVYYRPIEYLHDSWFIPSLANRLILSPHFSILRLTTLRQKAVLPWSFKVH